MVKYWKIFYFRVRGTPENCCNNCPIYDDCTFSSGELKPFNQQYIQGFNLVPFELDSEIIWNSLGTIQFDAMPQQTYEQEFQEIDIII